MAIPRTDETPRNGLQSGIRALFLDVLLLSVVGYGVGLLFGNQLVQMGRWGHVVGFGMALGYFGVFHSRIGRGQSIGKRILGIRVVGDRGGTLSLPRSLLRTAILWIPYSFGSRPFPFVNLTFLDTLTGLIMLGLGTGMVYFYVFNRRTRQSLHDLIVRTYVVRKAWTGEIAVGPIARLHYKENPCVQNRRCPVWKA